MRKSCALFFFSPTGDMLPVRKIIVPPASPKPRKKPVAQTARRQRIAADIVSGRKVSAIAKEHGISRPWASHEAHAEETQALIAALIDQRMPRMMALLDKSLDAVEQSLKAMKTVLVRSKVKNAGEDHFARLTGVKRYIELSLAGRILKKSGDKKEAGPITLQAIEQALAQAKHVKAAQAGGGL
jgi:hypothetical protein